MSELRLDYLEDCWVLIAPGRARRPNAELRRYDAGQPPKQDAACPFCPGNEHELGALLAERPGLGEEPWATRAAANRFPIVTPPAGGPDPGALHGAHEVVVETCRHDIDLIDLAPEQLEQVVLTYRDRLRAHADAAWATVFRNSGPNAGSTLRHAHAQLVAFDRVPPLVAAREQRARRHFTAYGRCYLCEVLARERRPGGRLVAERDGFAALVPHAAEMPCELWLLPARHAADFRALSDAGARALADLISDMLKRQRAVLGERDYNMMIIGVSRAVQDRGASWHWYLRLRPRLAFGGGFELGSGIAVNSSVPEADAARLRAAPGR